MAPVRLAIVGAGSRGTGYAAWALQHPDRARVVAVAEPRADRRQHLAAGHGLAGDDAFETWRELLAAEPAADAVVIATLDADHIGPAIGFASTGYHTLLEKPMAPTADECIRLVEAVDRTGVIAAVCHVLRYTPYTTRLKQIIDSGGIGDIVSVQHLEPVGFWHQAHSFVRGNWRREDEASFMLLAKSCHDLDWLRHIVGAPIERVSSFGSLSHFTPAHRPPGAADRCLDCAVEPDCAYSARRLYLGLAEGGWFGWPVDVLTSEPTVEAVTSALAEGPYGRCVYTCDNDVVDHQVVALEFANRVTATFTMTAFTALGHRRTQVFGSRGELHGDGHRITIFDFLTEQTRTETIEASAASAADGHGGGDAGLMDAFVSAVAAGDPSRLQSGLAESLETHLAVFAAERARHNGTVEQVVVPALSGGTTPAGTRARPS